MKPFGSNRLPTPALAASALGAFLLLACSKEEPPPPPEPQAAEQASPIEPAPFAPPSDGLLTEDQVRRFLRTHEAMSAINDRYLDSLADASPERRRSILQALDLAREKAPRRFGLNGYAEYRWILEEAPKRPENADLLERLKVITVTGSSR